jgi:hypothetical protein
MGELGTCEFIAMNMFTFISTHHKEYIILDISGNDSIFL